MVKLPDTGLSGGGSPATTEDNSGGSRVDSTLNVAGYWTLGVARGLLFVVVPIAVVGLAWGLSQKVLLVTEKLGRME